MAETDNTGTGAAAGHHPPGDIAHSLAQGVAGALAWWREAGVDLDFADAPRAWLAPGEQASSTTAPAEQSSQPNPPHAEPATAPAKQAPPAQMLGGPREQWPTSLPAFQAWWLSEASLDDPEINGWAPADSRVPPRGPPAAELMILVPQPEEGDSTHLLSGPRGKLLSAMLPMLGLAEAEVYVASALPRAVALPDWTALAARGLGDLLTHHVALVAPRRVIAFGSGILSLLGHSPPQNAATFHSINQEGFAAPLLPAHELAMLLERPGAKAAFWHNWLAFTGGSLPDSSRG